MNDGLEPLNDGRVRNRANELLGEVLRHQDVLGASHGCVEVTRVRSVIESLISERNSAVDGAENYRRMLGEMEQLRDKWKAEAMRNQALVERLVAAQR